MKYDLQKIDEAIYDKANTRADFIGEDSAEYTSPTGEQFIEYANKIEMADFDDCRKKLENGFFEWLDAYACFKKKRFHGVIGYVPDFTIYWRIRPEIKSIDGYLYIYARLLITAKKVR